jgi:hypothetical protein
MNECQTVISNRNEVWLPSKEALLWLGSARQVWRDARLRAAQIDRVACSLGAARRGFAVNEGRVDGFGISIRSALVCARVDNQRYNSKDEKRARDSNHQAQGPVGEDGPVAVASGVHGGGAPNSPTLGLRQQCRKRTGGHL